MSSVRALAALAILAPLTLSCSRGTVGWATNGIRGEMLIAPGAGKNIQRVSVKSGAIATTEIRLKMSITITMLARIGDEVFALGGELDPFPIHTPGLFKLSSDGTVRRLNDLAEYSRFGSAMATIGQELLIASGKFIYSFDPATSVTSVLTLPGDIAVNGESGLAADSDHFYFATADGRLAAVAFAAPQEISFASAPTGLVVIRGVCRGHLLVSAQSKTLRLEFPWAEKSLGPRIDRAIRSAPGIVRGLAEFSGGHWIVSAPEFPNHYVHCERIESDGQIEVPGTGFRSAVELPANWN